jgi:hypothetical protein
MNLKELL